jgi:hypothetical protein
MIMTDDYKYEKKLYNRNNASMVRLEKNKYIVFSDIENKNMELTNILDFCLIKLMYLVHQDRFEKLEMDIIDNNNAKFYILFKHLYSELGLKHRYISFHINKYIDVDNKVVSFILTQDENYGRKKNNSMSASMLPIVYMMFKITIKNNHKLHIKHYIYFDNKITIPSFVEPIFIQIVKTMQKNMINHLSQLQI